MLNDPHNRFFLSYFSDPDAARGFLEAVVPSEVAEVVDWATLRAEKVAFY